MENNNFARHLSAFFTEYLACERGFSPNTIRSYSNTFVSFLSYMESVCRIKPEKMELKYLCRSNINAFLDWIQEKNGIKDTTRNQRLAAIHAFCRYMQYEDVAHIEQWQQVLAIKIKKTAQQSVNYLTLDGIKLILSQIPQDTRNGRRDLAIISLLYESGARVQELIDLTPKDLHLESPYYVTLFGKGRKKRLVPIQSQEVTILKSYMEENGMDKPAANHKPLFQNNRGGKLTGAGITFILSRYVANARIINKDLIPDKISPHSLRHSKAMHLLQAGVNLVYIRDILGHVSIQTTEVYAKADSKQKREALEAAYADILPHAVEDKTSWEKDSELKSWLKSLSK